MATKDDIKRAAFLLFSEKGFEGTTVQDIGKAVGLKKQSLYSHINSKNDLIFEILTDESALILNELRACIDVLKNGTAEELLKGIFACFIRIFSVRERLLLWRRAIVSFEILNNIKMSDDWKFDKELAKGLSEILAQKCERFKDQKHFYSFFLTYMIIINGYLDLMLQIPSNETIMTEQWNKLWRAIEVYFS